MMVDGLGTRNKYNIIKYSLNAALLQLTSEQSEHLSVVYSTSLVSKANASSQL